MTTVRFERDGAIGNIVLADPPFNRVDLRYAETLRAAVHQASKSDIRVLVVRSEGPHFSFGGEVREWPGKDINWFRTFVADVNISYRAIEMLKVPTVAVVQGIAFGGGFELALACDFLVAAENATLRCVEVTTAMLPIAGALQRIAERAGRARASRFAMLGEPISGTEAGMLGIATHVVPEDQLAGVAAALSRGGRRHYPRQDQPVPEFGYSGARRVDRFKQHPRCSFQAALQRPRQDDRTAHGNEASSVSTCCGPPRRFGELSFLICFE
jgi:enoyl-CoA hydratase/carnithine racemase